MLGATLGVLTGLVGAAGAFAAETGADSGTSFLFPHLPGANPQYAQSVPAGSNQRPNLAQRQIERGQTVRGRPRPDYDPQGLRVGTFTLYPEMVVAPLFDDNVFRDEEDTESDVVTVLSPTVRLESGWANHALNFEAGADVGLYVDHDEENFEDYHFATDGRLDITRDTALSVAGGVAHLHQGRGDPDDPAGALEPTTFDRYTGILEGSHRFGRFRGILTGGFRRLDYEDVPRITPGAPDINNDDRDNNQYEGSAQLNYEIVPDYEAFVRGSTGLIDYDDEVDDNGFDRDSHFYDVVAGIDVDFGGIIFGDFFAGYTFTEREDDALENIDGFNVGADITWNITQLTTIVGTVEREVRDTTLQGASGSLATTVGLQVDHELLRNLIVSLNASGRHNDFEGIDRTDYDLIGGVAVDYYINRYIFVGALYEHRHRLSSGDLQGNDFAVNIAGVRAGAQF